MDINTLSQELKQQAIAKGLCQEWTEDWHGNSLDELLKMYKDGFDFCVQHDYPSVDFIRKYMPTVDEYGVYVDKSIAINSNNDEIVCLGKTTGYINSSNYDSLRLHIRHKCEISVNITSNAIAHISIYDGAKVNIVCEDNAKCFIYNYSEKPKHKIVFNNGNVKLYNKSL